MPIWYWGMINYNAQWVNVNIGSKEFPKEESVCRNDSIASL